MNDRVTIEIDNHIAEVTLNRPDKLNAMDGDMFEALKAAGERLKTTKDLRVVILKGAGKGFCAGIDVSFLMQMASQLDNIKRQMLDLEDGQTANPFQRVNTIWQELKVPVIACLHGVTFGAGAQLALAADFRIADPDTRLSIMESKWGLIPDMGITQSLNRLTRPDIAKELIMTARILDAPEAQSLGLLTRVTNDPLTEARSFAKTLAARSPDAIQAAKQLIDQSWNATPSESLKLEAELQAALLGSPNQIETVMAQMQKREANYE